jgi:SAM-dependent methyltransferase
MPATGTEGGVDAASFVPSSARYGQTAAAVVRCTACGHGSLSATPPAAAVDEAYVDAADPVSRREETGQVATADRDLATVERWVHPGRLLDIGCWTGSFLVAAARRGWEAEGIEPSEWARGVAVERGCAVEAGTLEDHALAAGAYRAVVACDVLEHLLDPGPAVTQIVAALEPGGVFFLTVPDAGSRLARAMGRRWWSVLPMHVQYYSRPSMARLLRDHGLTVVHTASHAKIFSTQYYAERVDSFVPVVGKLAVRAARGNTRLIGPDFRDRMAIVARKPA